MFLGSRGIAKVGELVNFEACLDIMDLLYEKEETSVLYSSPCSLAASILACSSTVYQFIKFCALLFILLLRVVILLQVASYVITVPRQKWEFPVLPWGMIPPSVNDFLIIATLIE